VGDLHRRPRVKDLKKITAEPQETPRKQASSNAEHPLGTLARKHVSRSLTAAEVAEQLP
jgi:hypothetical protein